jgi:hypothetical protein
VHIHGERGGLLCAHREVVGVPVEVGQRRVVRSVGLVVVEVYEERVVFARKLAKPPPGDVVDQERRGVFCGVSLKTGRVSPNIAQVLEQRRRTRGIEEGGGSEPLEPVEATVEACSLAQMGIARDARGPVTDVRQ